LLLPGCYVRQIIQSLTVQAMINLLIRTKFETFSYFLVGQYLIAVVLFSNQDKSIFYRLVLFFNLIIKPSNIVSAEFHLLTKLVCYNYILRLGDKCAETDNFVDKTCTILLL